MNETQRNIKRYKAALPGLRERVTATALLLLVSLSMLVSTSLAWYTISTAPEVSAINTTVAANGNLEIALVGRYDENGNVLSPDGSKAGDSSASDGQTLVSSNITWGNLVNLSDASYGLSEISLRPALLSGYNMTRAPLYGATYGADGRVQAISETYEYVSYTDFGQGIFKFAGGDKMKYGVRAIASVTYENATGQSFEKQIMEKVNNAYADVITMYADVVDNKTDVGGIKSMDALCLLLEIYVDEQATRKLDDENPNYQADYAGTVYYMYNLVDAFCGINDKEGEALCHLVNLVAYKAGTVDANSLFKDIDTICAAYKDGTLESVYKVNLASLDGDVGRYVKNREDIYTARQELSEYNCDAYKPDNNPTGVYWTDISGSVAYLVDIDEATIAEKGGTPTKIKNLSKLGTTALASMVMGATSESKALEVVLTEGTIADTEQRLGSLMNGTVMAIPVNIEKGVPIVGSYKDTVYAKVSTDATTDYPPYNNYLSYYDREQAASGTFSGQGDAVAKETYGMAMDLWLRTNMADTYLTLEGSVITTEEPATCIARDGSTVQIYTAEFDDQTWELYKLKETVEQDDGTTTEVTNWFNAVTHDLVKTQNEMDEAKVTPIPKTVAVIVGYDGENRIWEDYLSLVGDGVIPEESTTQGAGSCYVFYANPSDQTRILELLKSFTVEFLDQKGNSLATACLDTDYAYAINGKVTVPLTLTESKTTYSVLIAEATEETEARYEEHLAICALEQNQDTWITAVVYLDGMRLTNEQVLSAGEIEGRLNLQFGSNISLTAGDNEDLLYDSLSISAQAYFNDSPSVTSPGVTHSENTTALSAEYDGTEKKVTVELTIDGDHPNTISGFFIRKISSSQGSRMDSETFTRVEGTNVWKAEFDLSKPGEYIMTSVIADGVEYRLEKTIDDVLQTYYPTVVIDGLGVTSVRCTYDTGNGVGSGTGTVLTANSYVDVDVTVGIAATEELMPKQVRAIFQDSYGKEYTAILSYANGYWSGKARIESSGTYTLTYVVMDGEYENLFAEKYDSSFRPTIMATLGLQVQVGCLNIASVPAEYTGEYPLHMTVKIVDDSGKELRGLTGVELVYHSAASSQDANGMNAKMSWKADGTVVSLGDGETWESDGRYYGVMNLASPGIFRFNRVDVTVTTDTGETESSIFKATVAPTFTCMSKEPPKLLGNETDDYQLVPDNLGRLKNSTWDSAGNVIYDAADTTAGATMGVVLTNAEAAKIWAVIEDQDQNTYLVESKENSVYRIDLGETGGVDNGVEYLFDVPTNATGSYIHEQDGRWTLKALCFQNVYIPAENEGEEDKMYSTGTAPTEQNYADVCYVIPVEGNETKVVETVKVAAYEVEGDKLKDYKGEVFGLDAEDNVIGTFLTAYTAKDVVLKLTDFEGKPVTVRADDAEENDGIVEFVWQVTYNNDPSSYGHYTTDQASEGIRTITMDADDFNATYGGYVVSGQVYQFSGTYDTTSVKYTYGDSSNVKTRTFDADELVIGYEVWSKEPTVTVSAVSPGEGTTKRYYRVNVPTHEDELIEGAFNRVLDEYNALVYIYYNYQDGLLDQEWYRPVMPTVTLELDGVAASSYTATMLFKNGTDEVYNKTFTFTNQKTSNLQSIGFGENGTESWGSVSIPLYPAGEQIVDEITVVSNDVTYTVGLSHPVTINQPACPTNVVLGSIYAVDPTYGENTEQPTIVYSSDGTHVTLPATLTTWTYDDGRAVQELEYGDYSFVQTDEKTYRTTGSGCNRTTYYYFKNRYQRTGTTESELYRVTKKVQWEINGVLYNPGDVVEVSGSVTATPVTSFVSESFVKTTKIKYTETSWMWEEGDSGWGYTEVTTAPTLNVRFGATVQSEEVQ